MKIHTFYSDIYDKKFGIDTNIRLLELWKENWSLLGWEPVVLGYEDAKGNPRYSEYLAKFRTFPTSNSKDYELACFMRWVAMEMVGGYHCDFDVFNYGYHGEGEKELTFYSKYMVPCMVYGTKGDYSRMLELFMSYNPKGKSHVSDQSILVENVDTFPHKKRYLCPEIGQEGNYYRYELVHYPNGVMSQACMQPRWRYVKHFNDIILGMKGLV